MTIENIVFAAIPTRKQFVNMTSMRFSKLEVLGFCGSYYYKKQIRHLWWCRCDCGKIVKVRGDHLKSGNTTSCDCRQREIVTKLHTKHGHCRGYKATAIYAVWRAMIDRCYNPNDAGFIYYGARGIAVCDRWRESVVNFVDDMGERPEDGTIDRIDNNGPYCKENCRWVTQQEQMKNTRQNHYVTYQGETLCLKEWSRRFKIPYTTLRHRIIKCWPLDKAFVSNNT